MRHTVLALVLLALVLLALVRLSAAAAQDPPFVGWSALLPGLSLPYDAGSGSSSGLTHFWDTPIAKAT
jgi:hypothetical protein